MIGNDVVDLGDLETRPGAQHPRFDARVFAPSERRALEDGEADNGLRWILWAAKESAFKAARREDESTVFAPSQFVVELDPDLRGRVRHRGRDYAVRVSVDRDRVHAVATDLRAGALRAGCRLLTAHDIRTGVSSRAAREFAASEIARLLAVSASHLRFRRRGRIPELHPSGSARSELDSARLARLENSLGRLAVSISHHGRFVAYACWQCP
ncbi:MAG: 4'-phosphopantetheinyl transferase superfamily protein [Myxococcota bacterium]